MRSEPRAKLNVKTAACLMPLLLSACAAAPIPGDYCDVARPIHPTGSEIDAAVDAGLMELLRRVDREDAKWDAFRCAEKTHQHSG